MDKEFRDRMQELRARLEQLQGLSRCVGEAAREGTFALNRFTIADHPDLDALNHELNNLYGQSFD